MQDGWLSAEQVAEGLGLHVRTVRGYIRSGRLKAVRIGKQYRIARADLDEFTGRAADTAPPRVEVSTVVEVDALGPRAADRLSTLLVAGAQQRRDATEPLRVRTVYDDGRGRLKVIVLGDLAATVNILRFIDDVLTEENGMFHTDPTTPEVGHG
ncbi:helix-turn-helix domain-containing protein [Micromonospora sp. NPDC051296]|uniref:helix-turn-helix domain-containing protein n=1 Tax=Micromonospora sp. NPDC051296 TaxID=3155046 RepID=UPI00341CC2AD